MLKNKNGNDIINTIIRLGIDTVFNFKVKFVHIIL